MKEELDEYYQKKTRKNLEELEQFYEEKLRVKKEEITMSLKQDFEDEVKKMVGKMRIEFQRRKEKERFDRYERIKREIVEAKKRGKKVGNFGSSFIGLFIGPLNLSIDPQFRSF